MQIEDILPLSPLQEGLLFHALYDEQAPDVYTVQLVLALEGALDEGALKAAAQALLTRHDSLRASFRQQELSRAVQVIVRDAAVPWRRHDLSRLPPSERDERLAQLLAEDRTRRFDLAVPPLIRFMLVRLSPREHRLVITNHHLLLDGWSTPILVRELLALYAGNGRSLAPVRRYRDYLSFLARQDRAGALADWRETLAGLEGGTLVAPTGRGTNAIPEKILLALDGAPSAALMDVARRQGVTLNTVVQAAWAMLLGRLTGRDDVVFGVTVAGRPPEVAGIENMVGLFINTLPLRVQLPPGTALLELLRQVPAVSLTDDALLWIKTGGDHKVRTSLLAVCWIPYIAGQLQ